MLKHGFRVLKHGCFWLYRLVFWLVLVLGIAWALVIMVLAYFVLPNIEEYSDPILSSVSQAIGQTVEIGRIEGGVARNIVPQKVSIVGEARSHDPVKLQEQTEHMLSCFEAAADEMTREIDGKRVRPEIHVEVRSDFPSMSVDEKAPVVTLARNAAEALGQDLKIRLGGGGSGANIFNGHGIEMIILATGMTGVHTHDESVAVADMVHVTELLVEIIRQA